MSIALIPVVEVIFNQNKVSPQNKNVWRSLAEWTAYQQACALLVGLEEKVKPIEIGYSFYNTAEISLELLHFIVEKEIKEVDGKWEELSALYGGYLLQENGRSLLFPQTIGTLKDIQHWENIAHGKEIKKFWIGAPSPKIVQTSTELFFDFASPNPPFIKTKFSIDKDQLKEAVIKAKEALIILENLINLLNFDVEIDNLGRQLIYH